MDQNPLPKENYENRSGRMSVLAWHPKEGNALNLFTHIRHRRDDAIGPWAGNQMVFGIRQNSQLVK